MKSSHGDVEVSVSAKHQLTKFEPVEVGVSLRLPILDGEDPEEAIRRVARTVRASHNEVMQAVIEDGQTWKQQATSTTESPSTQPARRRAE